MSETEWVENAFKMLVQCGIVEVRMENGEEQYRFTEKGLRETKQMIENDENAQLLIFTLHFNMLSGKEEKKKTGQDKYVALKKTLKFMEQFNPDFFEVFQKGIKDGKIRGISLKERKETTK